MSAGGYLAAGGILLCESDFMSQEAVNLVLGVLVAVMPVITLLAQKIMSRRKDATEYGNDLLEVANNTAKALKAAREELDAVNEQVKGMGEEHEREIEELRNEQNKRIDRMKARILELEKVIVRYEISFTLQTHPVVQVNDLKVVGKESVSDSQKLRAVDPNDSARSTPGK